MTTTSIIAQIFGMAGILAFIMLYQFNDMKKVLKTKMVMDVLWASHYLLLGATSAFAVNAICLVRECVFINDDKKIFKSRIWLWIFIAFNIVSAILTWKGYFSILPAMTSTLATISFKQKSVKVARVIGITNNVMMFIYDIFVGSYMGLIAESLAFLAVVVAIFRNKSQKAQ